MKEDPCGRALSHRCEPLTLEHEVREAHVPLPVRFLTRAVARDLAPPRVVEHAEVEVRRLLGPAALFAGEHEGGHDERPILPGGIRQDQLPGHPVSVLHPAVELAVGVPTQRDQDVAACCQGIPSGSEPLLGAVHPRRVVVQEERHRRIESEQGARADRHEVQPGDREGDGLGISAGGVMQGDGPADGGVRERRRVELGGLTCFLVEPKVGSDPLHDHKPSGGPSSPGCVSISTDVASGVRCCASQGGGVSRAGGPASDGNAARCSARASRSRQSGYGDTP